MFAPPRMQPRPVNRRELVKRASRVSRVIRVASPREARREAPRSESLSPVHPPAGGNVASYGGDSTRGLCCLLAIASLGAAGSGLPHHPSGYLLSRCES